MIRLTIGVILVLLAIAAVFVTVEGERVPGYVPLVLVLVAAAFIGSGCLYTQDAGEVIVKKNLGGSLAGYTEEAGFHAKAPWQSTLTFDTRSCLLSLYREQEYKYDGGNADGACVTANDSSGASCDIDLQVVYSLDADAAMQLYVDFGSQKAYTEKVLLNDVRAITREVAGKYDTITLLTARGEFMRGLRDELTAHWSDMGLEVDSVAIQDIRYPDNIKQAYANAQAAEIDKSKAENEQATARVVAETKVIEAKGEAEANEYLSKSLTPEVIQQHYIDALREIGHDGNLVVVPEGSTPIVQAEPMVQIVEAGSE